MIAVTDIPRVFNLKKNGEILQLEDLSPSLAVDDIKDLYSAQYPELVNATIINKGVENDNIVYEFQTIAGTKG